MFFGGHYALWHAAFAWLAFLVFAGAVGVATYALVATASRHRGPEPREDPRTILDRRLARGEVTPEEYERLRDLLDGSMSNRT